MTAATSAEDISGTEIEASEISSAEQSVSDESVLLRTSSVAILHSCAFVIVSFYLLFVSRNMRMYVLLVF